MNGPVILSNAREYLAQEIFAYHEPKPAPLKISPWVAMSCLQKAIRRGESELATRSGNALSNCSRPSLEEMRCSRFRRDRGRRSSDSLTSYGSSRGETIQGDTWRGMEGCKLYR
jgi:hypothetical protein